MRRSGSVGAYYELMKPKIVYLLDFTALTAFLVAAPSINLLRLVAVIVAGTLASGGAGALNCYLDRDVDRTMGRTSWRPIPQGEISPHNALVFVWTPSHFWALAMRAVGDYSKAGIPMLPVVVGEKKTAQYIALNTFLLVPISLAFVLPSLGGFGIIYLVTAGLLGLGMILVDL